MKLSISLSLVGFLLIGCSPTDKSSDTRVAMGIDYSPKERFSRTELRRLANNPKQDTRRLMWLINRAAAERDDGFQDLLIRDDLRRIPELDLSLANYDYSINGSLISLNYILSEDERSDKGGDTMSVLVMSFMNEWDKTITAIGEHEKHADGAGGMALADFWMTRRDLFPEDYRRYNKNKPNPKDSFSSER